MKAKQSKLVADTEQAIAFVKLVSNVDVTAKDLRHSHAGSIEFIVPKGIDGNAVALTVLTRLKGVAKFDMFDNHHGSQYTWDMPGSRRVAVEASYSGTNTITLMQW